MSNDTIPLPEPYYHQWSHSNEHHAWIASQVHAHAAAVTADRDAEIAALRAEIAQLRQYLDTAQRRAAALGDEVAGLREALHSIAWSRPLGRTSKMVEALEKKALAALAARKGTT